MRLHIVVVGVVALAIRLAMARAIPLGSEPGDPNCAPDEADHVRIVKLLASGSMPRWPAVHLPYAAYLPANSLVQAATLALLSPLDRPSLYRRHPLLHPGLDGYPLARLGSVALGVATAVLLALAAGVLTGRPALALACGLAAACYPQLAFVGSYVNEDAFTAAAGSLLVYLLARWVSLGEGEAGLRGVVVGCALVLLGKPNGFALLPPTVLWILGALLGRRLTARSVVRALGPGLLIAGLPLGWNAWRNGGDVFGTAALRAFMAENPAAWKDARAYPDPLPGFLEWFTKSSFGVFGNMNVPLPRSLYLAAAALLVTGTLLALARLRTASGRSRRAAAWLCGALLTNAVLVFHYSWFVNFQPQGRYALLPTVLLTLAAVAGPAPGSERGLRRLWPPVYVAFLMTAAVVSVRLLALRPCGG